MIKYDKKGSAYNIEREEFIDDIHSDAGNYYGHIVVFRCDGKCFIGIGECDGTYNAQEISSEIFEALKKEWGE